jgi:hypothetical protein
MLIEAILKNLEADKELNLSQAWALGWIRSLGLGLYCRLESSWLKDIKAMESPVDFWYFASVKAPTHGER